LLRAIGGFALLDNRSFAQPPTDRLTIDRCCSLLAVNRTLLCCSCANQRGCCLSTELPRPCS